MEWVEVECEQAVIDARDETEPEFVRHQYVKLLLPRVPAAGEYIRWTTNETYSAELVDDAILYTQRVAAAEGLNTGTRPVAALLLATVFAESTEALEAEDRKLEMGWTRDDSDA
jgi:hypothetical protein